MRIAIEQIYHHALGIVRFSSEIGCGTANWRGSALPQVGTFDVEIEVPGSFVLGSNIRLTDGTEEEIRRCVEGNLIRARVDGIEEDGLLRLRLGGGLFLVDTERPLPSDIVGRLIELDAPELDMYPFDV